jgi:hypothetical protein
MLKNNHKGNEMSLGMIITAVLVLLVLLIMAFLLMGGANNWNKGTNCQNQGGECISKLASCGSVTADKTLPSPFSCPQEQKCCVKPGFGD